VQAGAGQVWNWWGIGWGKLEDSRAKFVGGVELESKEDCPWGNNAGRGAERGLLLGLE